MPYPYTYSLTHLKAFLEDLPKRAVPVKIDASYVAKLNIPIRAAQFVVSVLKGIGLLDSEGKPTKAYQDFRIQSKSAETMKKCVRDTYKELFEIYPDACATKDDDLVAFFSQANPKAGAETIRCTVGTFRLLCTYAREKVPEEQLRPSKPKEAQKAEARIKTPSGKEMRGRVRPTQGITINLNIQLNLPVTDDPAVYDRIFESLRKHLFELEAD